MMIRAAVLTLSIVAAGSLAGPLRAGAIEDVGRLLDDWHGAASEADGVRYFSYFAPDGIFLGTDATERWTVDEFRAYAEPHFSNGRGWKYRPHDRHVALSADGTLAWVDEKLENEKYGLLRGTAVLRQMDGEWKLAHYSMSFTIPNDATRFAVAVIRAASE